MSNTVKEAVLLSIQTFKPTGLMESLRDKQESDGCLVLTNLALLFHYKDGMDEERFSLDSVLTVKHLSKPGSLRLDIFFKNNIQKSFNFARHDKALVLQELIPILSDIGVGRLSTPLGIPENLAEIHTHLHIQPVSLSSSPIKIEPPLDEPVADPPPLLGLSILPLQPKDAKLLEPENPLAQQSVIEEQVDTVDHSVWQQPVLRETIHHPNFDPINEKWNLSLESTDVIRQEPKLSFPLPPEEEPSTLFPPDETIRTALDIELDFFGGPPKESGIQPFAPPTVEKSSPAPEVRQKETTTEEEEDHLFISTIPSLDSIPDDEFFASPAKKQSCL